MSYRPYRIVFVIVSRSRVAVRKTCHGSHEWLSGNGDGDGGDCDCDCDAGDQGYDYNKMVSSAIAAFSMMYGNGGDAHVVILCLYFRPC